MNCSFMILGSFGSNLMYTFNNSDSMGQAIVGLLFILSPIAWTAMISKNVEVKNSLKESERFLNAFYNSPKLMSASLMSEAKTNSGPLAAIYRQATMDLQKFYDENAKESGQMTLGSATPGKLNQAQLGVVETNIECALSKELEMLKKSIGFISTMVSLCPFLGLFGTVWGVMMAFCGIAIAGKADFTALAPGVAGALLTTVAGLFVAIPSLIGNNWLNSRITKQIDMCENFVGTLLSRLDLEQAYIEQSTGFKVEETK